MSLIKLARNTYEIPGFPGIYLSWSETTNFNAEVFSRPGAVNPPEHMDQAFNFIDHLTTIFLLHKKFILPLATLSWSWREEINAYIYCCQDFTWRIIYNNSTQWYTLLKMVNISPVPSLKSRMSLIKLARNTSWIPGCLESTSPDQKQKILMQKYFPDQER